MLALDGIVAVMMPGDDLRRRGLDQQMCSSVCCCFGRGCCPQLLRAGLMAEALLTSVVCAGISCILGQHGRALLGWVGGCTCMVQVKYMKCAGVYALILCFETPVHKI